MLNIGNLNNENSGIHLQHPLWKKQREEHAFRFLIHHLAVFNPCTYNLFHVFGHPLVLSNMYGRLKLPKCYRQILVIKTQQWFFYSTYIYTSINN